MFEGLNCSLFSWVSNPPRKLGAFQWKTCTTAKVIQRIALPAISQNLSASKIVRPSSCSAVHMEKVHEFQ